METLETDVAAHYTTEDLLARIDAGLTALGVTATTADDLKPVDEFHTGGVKATEALLSRLEISPEMRVLDIGCGLGGTARYIAQHYGAHVTGIDLTPVFVAVGQALNARVGLDDRIDLQVASALDLPMQDASCDLVTMLHVGMNIAEKDRLFAEAARVLKPGGHFAVFDVMEGAGDGDLIFPLPWSTVPATSHVAPPRAYRALGHAAGLHLVEERSRTEFALRFFEGVFAAMEQAGRPPPLGIHLLMGPTAGKKLKNFVANLTARRVAPVEMIFQKPA